MRGVYHVLVLQPRVAAFEFAHDVVRVNRAQRVADSQGRRHPERHGLERARQRLLLQRVEVLPGKREDCLCRVERDPALDGRAVHVPARRHQVELLPQVALHDGERIPGRRGFVHDEDPRRSLARPLLEFVRPPAVVRHGVAAERLRIELRGIRRVGHGRVVHEDDDGLPLHVHVLEVVPVELRRLDAVAGEHDVGILDRRGIGDVLRPRHHGVRPLERLLPRALRDGERPRLFGRAADERDFLHVSAVRVAWLQAELLDLFLEVRDRQVLPLRPGGSPFELVGGQDLDAFENRLRIDLRHRRERQLGGPRRERDHRAVGCAAARRGAAEDGGQYGRSIHMVGSRSHERRSGLPWRWNGCPARDRDRAATPGRSQSS